MIVIIITIAATVTMIMISIIMTDSQEGYAASCGKVQWVVLSLLLLCLPQLGKLTGSLSQLELMKCSEFP